MADDLVELDFSGNFEERLAPVGSYSGRLVVDYTTDTVTGDLAYDTPTGSGDFTQFYIHHETSSIGTQYGIFSGADDGTTAPPNFSMFYFGESPSTFSGSVILPGYDYFTDVSGSPVTSSAVVCFTTGTNIRTTRGNIPVEDLRIGDIAITASGGHRPITWIGNRTIANPGFEGSPVRIRAGAFAANVPARDLYLSPGHPVLVGADEDGSGGHLVPIMCLINGTTVERTPAESVTYWHVELDKHDILLAEGLPAESYFDMGSRAWFEGADGPLVSPDLVSADAPGRCRPVAIDGPIVEAERRRLDSVFAAYLDAQCDWRDEALT